MVILDEDGVSGTYVLTLKGSSFSREEAMKYFYEMGLKELPKPDMVMTPEQLTQYEEKLTAKEAEIAAEKAKPAVRAEGAAAVAAGAEEAAPTTQVQREVPEAVVPAPAGEVVEKVQALLNG